MERGSSEGNFYSAIKTFPNFMDPNTFLSQKPASCLCSDPDKYSPSPSTLSYYYNRLDAENFRQTNPRHGHQRRFYFTCVLCRSELYVYIAPSCLPLWQSACNNSAPTAENVIKFHMWGFLEKPEKIQTSIDSDNINPLQAELNPICHLLTLLDAHHIFHVSRIRVKRRRKSAPLYRHWGSVLALRPIGGVKV
jgi:hypothetical protein